MRKSLICRLHAVAKKTTQNVYGINGSLRSFSSGGVSAILNNESNDAHKLIVRSKYPEVPIVADATFPELIWSHVGKWHNLPAFECAVTGRVYAHNEIYKYSQSFATALRQSGLKRGDVVGIILPNLPEYPIALLGILEAGLACSPMNSTYMEGELFNLLKISEAKCIVTTDDMAPVTLKLKSRLKFLRTIIVVDKNGGSKVPSGTHSFFEMMKTDSRQRNFLKIFEKKFDPTQTTALIPFSSGTTGLPKGVNLTHSNLATNLLQFNTPITSIIQTFKENQEQERVLGILPFFHIFGLNVLMCATLVTGAHIMCIPKFDPITLVEVFRKHKPTAAHVVPPLITFMVNHPNIGKKEVEHLHSVLVGGAPLGPNTVKTFLDKIGRDLFVQKGYGMTEASPVTHIQSLSSTNNMKPGNCGQVTGSTLAKIVDMNTGQLLGRNAVGELCIKGPQVMRGYYKNEKATAEIFDAQGWLLTGDIGYHDDDDYLFLVDRKKEIINVTGFQVSPSELENLLLTIPGVADCAVIGVPNEESGEAAMAYIVKSEENLGEKNIRKFLNDHVAHYKRLTGGIEFISAIPRSPAGKILRKDLQTMYLNRQKFLTM